MTTYPSRLIRLAWLVTNRRRQSARSAEQSPGDQWSVTFEFTLLTFWPPGPLLRAVEIEISSLGIVRRALTYKSAMIPLYLIAAYIVRRHCRLYCDVRPPVADYRSLGELSGLQWQLAMAARTHAFMLIPRFIMGCGNLMGCCNVMV